MAYVPASLPLTLALDLETVQALSDADRAVGRLAGAGRLLPNPHLFVASYLTEEALASSRMEGTRVRERGDVQGWLRFFLGAIAAQASRSVDRAEKLTDLRERYRSHLHGSRSRAGEVVDLLFGNPILTTRYVVAHLGVTPQGATHLLRQLTELKLLREASDGRRGVRARWHADEIMDVLREP
jgi:Fic family protein